MLAAMRKGLLVFLSSCLLVLLSACDAEQEFSSWPCRFSYDNSVYLDDVLASAMSGSSRGVFCQISEEARGGARYLNFTSSSGVQSQKRETTMEQQANYVLGLNNGIIVGFQTLNTDGAYGGFVGYDVQCPNCVRNTGNYTNPTYYVRMASTGIATCSRCGLKYDLNNGGQVLNGQASDKGLEKYVATTTGPFGFISVFRR